MVKSCFVYKPGCKISFGLTSPAVKNSSKPRRMGRDITPVAQGGQSSPTALSRFHGYLRG